MVLQLVTSTNRPYNTQLLADNLQTRGIKKPAVQRALDALVDQGKILCKVHSTRSMLEAPARRDGV